MLDEKDWRLEAELSDGPEDHHGALEGLVAGARAESHVAEQAKAAVGSEVAITHDGRKLFAYAAGEAQLQAARKAIEWLLAREGLAADIRVSHWHDGFAEWRQIDPPPDAAEEAVAADEERVETQTVVASVGKLVRAQVEAAMTQWAQEHSLKCELVEHPHLLTTQVAYTLTGPRHQIAEFRSALRAEGWATFRAEGFGTGWG